MLVPIRIAAALACALVPVAARAQPSTPPLAAKEAALTRWVFGRNADVHNDAFACRAQAGACIPGARHLTFVPPVAVPSMTDCAGTAALMACYAGAVERTQQALEQGNAATLFEAAERMRVVAKRADATATAPAWMKSGNPSNRLFLFFASRGIPMATPLPCTSGTDIARYQCLGASGGPSPAVYRAAINILDHHNDVKVNANQLTGARARLEAIFRSAAAPVVSAMTTSKKFDPRLGPGMPRIDLLGKISYLRRLTQEAGTIAVERQYLEGLTAYQVSATSPRVRAELALFGAARAARVTVSPGNSAVVNAALDADLTELLIHTDTAAHLALIRGATAAAYDAGRLTAHYARARTAEHFDAVPQRFDRLLTDMAVLTLGWTDGWQHCDWFTVTDITMSLTAYYPTTTTHAGYLPCLDLDVNDDEDCEEEEVEITTTTWVAGPTTTIVIGEELVAESIRGNYKRLLDADDGDWVDADTNGQPDVDLEADSTAILNPTISRAGIAATPCLAELATISGGYQHELDATDLDCVSGTNCQRTYGGSDGKLFLPYAMAARICPSYVKHVVGIDAVTLGASSLGSVSNSCPTPLEYVATVANTLEDADSKYLEGLDDLGGPMGKMLAYFSAEANLLIAPVAATLRQRADLAYFSAEPLGDCDDTTTGACLGLDVWGERLDQAEDAVRKALVMFRQFSRIHRTEVGLDGDEAMAKFSATSVNVCKACTGLCVDCLTNSEAQMHALAYRRIRDLLGTYESIRNDQLELAWRRLDAMPSVCVSAVDTNSDGVLDTNACDESSGACAAFCPHYAGLRELAATTRTDLTSVLADLEEQRIEIAGSPELRTLIVDIRTWAGGIANALDADIQAIDAGVDWLGARKGRWSIASAASGTTLTEAIEEELAHLEVDAEALSVDYNGWISSYLRKLTVQTDFANAAQAAALQTQSNIGNYCQDLAGNPAPNGCGVAVVLNDTNPTAQRINSILETKFCKLTMASSADVSVDIANPNSPFYLDAGDDYLDWIALTGLPDCPRLVTPNIATLTAQYGGSLITSNILPMQRALLDLEAAIIDYNEYVELMQYADTLFDSYQNAITTYFEREAAKEWLKDSLVCGAALVGATAATIGSYGAGAVTFVSAGMTCASRFAQGSENLFPNDGHYDAEELGFEGTYINQQVQQAEQLYSATMKLEAIMMRVADYRASVLAYQSELGAFRRTVAYGNTTLDALGSYQAFSDPVALALEQQELTSMRQRFKGFAGDIQSARRKIEYDISNVIPVGQTYARNPNELYWMPRVADITLASSAGADPASAYLGLLTNGGPALPEAQTLVATASLLSKVYADFRLVYGERYDYGEIGYIGSSAPGLVDSDGNGRQDTTTIPGTNTQAFVFGNPGERAMLGDSRFYDPAGPTASGCLHGQVDAFDYCRTFSPPAGAVSPRSCVDIRAMPLGRRMDLAHLDHMVRPPNVETFVCTKSIVNNKPVYGISARPGSAITGGFTGTDLPFAGYPGPWYRGAVNTVDTAYYAAQTATVKVLIDQYIDGVLDERAELSANFKFYPGTYLYGINTTDPWLEPEHDVLSATPFAAQTQSEQLDSLAVICTSSSGCGSDSMAVEDSKQVDVALFGPGSKGTRCRYTEDAVTLLDNSQSTFTAQSGLLYRDLTTRQAQLDFDMDHDLSAGNVQTIRTTSPELQPLIAQVLDNATLLQRPLHVSRMLFGVYALYGTNGFPDNTTAWSLHTGGSVDPRLRIAVRYSHYNTDPMLTPEQIDIDQFLECPANSERM